MQFEEGLFARLMATLATVHHAGIASDKSRLVFRGDALLYRRQLVGLQGGGNRRQFQIAATDLARWLNTHRPAQPDLGFIRIKLRQRPVFCLRREPQVAEIVGYLRHRKGLAGHDALQAGDISLQ